MCSHPGTLMTSSSADMMKPYQLFEEDNHEDSEAYDESNEVVEGVNAAADDEVPDI